MGEPFCKHHPDRKAHRVLQHGQGHVCEECWQLIVAGKDPAPKKHPVGGSKEVFVETCFCGREKGHRGRHKGVPLRPKVNIRMTPKIEIPIRRKLETSSQTRFSVIIAELKDERDRLNQAIAVLEGL